MTVYVDGQPVKIPASSYYENEQYPNDFCNGLVCLGAFENKNVLIQFATGAPVTDLHVGVLDYTLLEQTASRLNTTGMQVENLKQKHSGATFDVKNAEKGTVFIPVPFDKNWICKVNGENVSDQVTSIDGMMGIPVAEGTNTISIKYQAEGRVQGGSITFAALLICCSVWLLNRRGFFERHTKNVQEAAAWIVFAVFVAACIVFVFAMFVIPARQYMTTLSEMEDVN